MSAHRIKLRHLLLAALVLGAAGLLLPAPARAGSCCGGGVASSLVLPRNYKAVVDLSFEWEKYDGFWNQDGKYTRDPAGSDLNQYRLNLFASHRFLKRWQAGVAVPWVWNSNTYSGTSSSESGPGDITLGVWYEAVYDRSSWKLVEPKDLIPSVTIGASLLLPTGISPYDDVASSFDVTGRGFYRIDGNLLIDKTYNPWIAAVFLSYGTYVERDVNREYGKYIQPYEKDLGNRFSTSGSLSYVHFVGTAGDSLTGTASISYVHEADGTIDGQNDPTTAFSKTSAGLALAYTSTDHDWAVRASWNHAIQRNGWGENFPTTDVFSLGVRYGFR
jgi:hypothetical protein